MYWIGFFKIEIKLTIFFQHLLSSIWFFYMVYGMQYVIHGLPLTVVDL